MLRASTGAGLPLGARNSVSSIDSAPESHARDPRSQTEYAGQMFVAVAIDLSLGNLLELEDGGVELDGAVEIGNREADGVDTVDQRVRSGGEESAGQEQRTE